VVICLERGADFHMAQLMPLPLTVSCCSKIQIGFTFLVPADLGSPGQRAVKWVCVCAVYRVRGRSIAEWLARWTQAQKGSGFKSQPRRCRVTVLRKLFTPIVPLFTNQQNW